MSVSSAEIAKSHAENLIAEAVKIGPPSFAQAISIALLDVVHRSETMSQRLAGDQLSKAELKVELAKTQKNLI